MGVHVVKMCPECPDERVHRPYSKFRGKNWRPSISDLSEMGEGGGEGMAFKASEITARYCYRNEAWRDQPEAEAVDKARKVHKAMWATDRTLGTLAHSAAEAFADNDGWSLADVPADTVLYDHDAARLEQFVAGVYGWFDAHGWPKSLASEFIVGRNDEHGRYFGTGDNIFDLDGEAVLIDWKTAREYKEDESKKFHKWTFQLNALGLASHLCHFHGGDLVEEVPWSTTDVPRPKRGLIVSIGPDGTFREYGVDIDAKHLEVIAATCVQRAWRGKAQGMKPVAPPKAKEVAA